jgi:hypothetical protein
VLVRKREGEGGLNWGQRWRMGVPHCEAAEVVALRWEPERRVSGGGSRRGGRVSGGGGSSSSGVDAEQSGVRCRRLLQIGGRVGENKGGKWGGGVGSVPHGGRKTGERERAPGIAVGSADRGVGMAPSGVIGGGSVRSRRRLAGELRRAAGR